MMRKILIIGILLLLSLSSQAQEENYISLYLLNFTRHIEWPEETREGNFIIEVLGHVSVYERLKELSEGKKVGSQSIEVRNYVSASEVGKPHIMFVGHWQSRQMQEVLQRLEGCCTLLVTEQEGMIDKGSAINFIVREGKIQYEFNKDNALNRGLVVSSRLWQMGISQN
jgi:hypothetical protein